MFCLFFVIGVVSEQWPRLQKRYEHCNKNQTVLKNNMGYMTACMMSDSLILGVCMHMMPCTVPCTSVPLRIARV